MCDVTTALIIGGSAIATATGVAGDIMSHEAQMEAYNQNVRSAQQAARLQAQLINEQQEQEAQATARTIFEQDLEARRAEAATLVSAGESGIAGASVDMILDDIERQRLRANVDARRQFRAGARQAHFQKMGVEAQRRSRINSMSQPSGWATGLSVFGRLGAGTANVFAKYPQIGAGSNDLVRI